MANDKDRHADPAFYASRAIFMLRKPGPTILSIRNLFASIDSSEYLSDEQTADYYEERLQTMTRLWERFPASRRIGISHELLTTNPDGELDKISGHLNFDPPLINRYARSKASQLRGAGDPLSSHRFDSIVPSARSSTITKKARPIHLPPKRLEALERLFASTYALMNEDKQSAGHRTVIQP